MKSHHICEFKRIPLDLTPSFFSSNVIMTERFFKSIILMIKGQKKAKPAKRCRTCGKYAIECPYCKQKIESYEYPLKMTCPHCNKEFQVRWD